MQVSFERTGPRRYGVRIVAPGQSVRFTNPAPGFDEHIPHDLVHYLVEAELRLSAGVFGRAAQGGSAFFVTDDGSSARERRRAQRRQQRREHSLEQRDVHGEMARAERLALLCDIAWRRLHGHVTAAPGMAVPAPTPEESAWVARVVHKLEHIAPRWHALPVGGSLTFTWPSSEAE
ncbi:MAG TPA: hypothetical protein VFZ61_15255 [Polyangiales bacterium]